ncbi:hypothetical protein SteCoe_12176 [Stentor coeruleus]|uniref:Histidine kinase n=1 Tax=Stentor coeruleus TaxID=5963 RepID=A0A1R2CBD9_9CILI|nr:hypothetical protein SteCoe_12176 [Stentor coeruleus]
MNLSSNSEEAKILDTIKKDTIHERLASGLLCAMVIPLIHFFTDAFYNGLFNNYSLKIMMLGMFTYNYFFRKSLPSRSKNFVLMISIAVTELSNIAMGALAVFYFPDCLVFYSQTSTLIYVYHESFLISKTVFLCLLAAKQTVIWTFYTYMYSGFYLKDISAYISGLISVFLLYILVGYYDYKKDISLCKSKLENQTMHKNILAVVDSISDSILIIDQSNKIIFANSYGNKLVNSSSASNFFKRKKYYRRYCEEANNKKKILEDINSLFKTSINTEVCFGILHQQNELFEWKGKLIFWNNKESIILCGRNVTHLVNMEKESSESKYKSALLRTVSHELRTPTSAVISLTQIIESSEHFSPENAERLEIIKDSCSYQLCLINDLLDYAQILSGCLKITKIYFNMHQLFLDCMKIIKVQLNEKAVKLELSIKNIPDLICSDPYRLKQVLLNLLSNARKFTQKGKIILETNYEKNNVMVRCKDTGIGIAKEKIKELFIPFGTLESSQNMNPQGVGLGLVISNMLVKELGGNGIKVDSEVGIGSCFSFYIHVDSESSNTNSDVAEENTKIFMKSIYPKTILKRNEILIVDDTNFNILALTQILKNEGFSCFSVMNGEDAINSVKARDFSCVIMDCEMPIMDGWEACKKINKMFEENLIRKIPPIIAYTAHTSEVYMNKCKEAGMKDVIIKPCTPEDLLNKVKYWME